MQGLSADDWKHHIVYLYRKEPTTAITGVGGYVTKLQQAFDVDDIKQAYGGRVWTARLNGPGGTMLYDIDFRIEAPPKLDPHREASPNSNGSSVNGDTTSAVREALNLFRDELKNRVEAEGGPASSKVVEMLSSASEKAMEMVTRQVPQASNPAAQLKDMIGVMRELGLGGGQNTIVDTIKVLKELNLIGGAAADPTAQLNNMLSIFTKLDELRSSGAKGGGRRNGGTDWGGIVERGLELLPGLLQARAPQAPPAAQAGAMGRAVPIHPPSTAAPAVVRAAAVPAPQAGSAAAPPSESPAAAGPLPVIPFDRASGAPSAVAAAAGDAPTAGLEGQPPGQFTDAERDEWMESRVVEFILLGYTGAHVIDFLGSIDRGDLIGDIAKYPASVVTQFFQARPIMRQAVAHPRWTTVLAEAQIAAKEWVEADEADAAIADNPKVN